MDGKEDKKILDVIRGGKYDKIYTFMKISHFNPLLCIDNMC